MVAIPCLWKDEGANGTDDHGRMLAAGHGARLWGRAMIRTLAAGTSRQTLGMLSVAAGVSIFSLQDAIVKGMSASFPVHEIVFVRSLVALPSDAPHIRQKTQIAGTQTPLPNSRSVA